MAVGLVHHGVGLGQKFLDDHLLHVARTCATNRRELGQRTRHTLVRGLADADGDAGGERDRYDGRRPRSRADADNPESSLVGRAEVRAARLGPTTASPVVSSIIPIDGATGLSRCSSVHVRTPGFRCGSGPVSSSTHRHGAQ